MQINIHELLNESKLKIFNKWLSVHFFLPFWRISILEEHKICPFTLKVCPTALLTTLEHLWLKWIWSAGVNDIDVQKNKQEVLELPLLATPVSNL